MNFNYYIPTRIVFGSGQLDQLHTMTLPGSKALIVTSAGQSVIKYGYLDKLKKQLDMLGIGYVVFNKILPNPIHEHVMEGADTAKQNGCDFVIGLGGGSSMDSAKAIAIMATNSGDYWDYVNGGSGKGMPLANSPLPIMTVTTTAGTGTEADPWTVITKGEEKIGFGSDQTFPALSIVDPQLMESVPPRLTAFQGFDALFHSTEGYINNIANPMSDLYALEAIRLIGENLAAAVKNGKDKEAREKVAFANVLSGMVESTSSCVSAHSLAHALSAFSPALEHGAALIIVSKEYYSFAAENGTCQDKMVNMAKALGNKDAKNALDFVDALDKLQKDCDVDQLKLSDYGIERKDLTEYPKNARQTMGGLYAGDPFELSDMQALGIYEKSYR